MAYPTYLKIDAVLHLIKQRPGLTQREMSVALGYSAVNEVVKHLKDEGLVEPRPGTVRCGTRIADVWVATPLGAGTKTLGPDYGMSRMRAGRSD